MKYWYRRLSEAFLGLKKRERKIIIFAGALMVLYLGFIGWIEPEFKQQDRYQQQLAQSEKTTQLLKKELEALGTNVTDPDASLIDQRKALRREYEKLKAELGQKTTQLISANHMRQVLAQLLAEHKGVKVTEVSSEPVEKLSVSEQVMNNALYQRGFVIKLEGDYFSLQRYLTDIEQLPWQLYWRQFDYQVTEYPQARVTLKLYTLSTNESFLGV